MFTLYGKGGLQGNCRHDYAPDRLSPRNQCQFGLSTATIIYGTVRYSSAVRRIFLSITDRVGENCKLSRAFRVDRMAGWIIAVRRMLIVLSRTRLFCFCW